MIDRVRVSLSSSFLHACLHCHVATPQRLQAVLKKCLSRWWVTRTMGKHICIKSMWPSTMIFSVLSFGRAQS